MDALDLFRQLTRGVKFQKKQTPQATVKPESPTSIKAKSSTTSYKQNSRDEATSSSTDALLIEEYDSDFKYLDGESVPEPHLQAEPEPEPESELELEPMDSKRRKLDLSSAEKDRIHLEEEASQLREEHGITVFGRQMPPPITSFTDLRTVYNVSKQLVTNIEACHYPKPTPIQMQAIPLMLKGRPLMACAPTGSGKTVAFLTPIINDLRVPKKVGFRAIILAPTRELSQQIYRECVRLSERTALKIHIISKGNQAQQKLQQKKFDILISTPNRVRYLLKFEPPLISLRHIEWFVIDEADRLMEDGKHNFKEQIDDILAACTNPNKKLALFSATYTVPVARWALKNLKNLARVTIGQQNSAPDLVQQELLFVGSESGKLLAIRNLMHQGLKPPVLVFVQSKDRAKQLFEELLFDGINVDVIHADRTQQQRDNCVRAFREGNIWVLICTELMGRGIDFKGVNLVINYDFPPTTISYIHRIGRTGRAGRAGRAITFYTLEDTPMLKNIAYMVKNSGGDVPDFIMGMKKPSKLEKRKFANKAPSREDISTQIKPEKDRDVIKPQSIGKRDGSAGSRGEVKVTNKEQKKPSPAKRPLTQKQSKNAKEKTTATTKTIKVVKSKTKMVGVKHSKKKVKK